MSDPRVANLARALVQYSANVQPKDHVAVSGSPLAAPLITEVYREILRAGAFPYVNVGLEGLAEIFFAEAGDDQLQHVSRVEQMFRGEFDATIGIASASNTRSLSAVDPAKQQLRAKAHRPLMETSMKRGASGELKWVGTLYPTQAYAQDAEMSLTDFEDYVYGATYADTDDAVVEWSKIHDKQQRLVDWLKGRRLVEVSGPNIDMTLSIDGRTFINSDGHHNMPSGEIFTGPVEDSVNGWVRFTYPAVTQGREVEGIELTFENGRVVKASAQKNEAFLMSRATWASGPSARTTRSTGSSRTSCSTRKSAARSTWLSAPGTPTRAR